jgi:para-nitrobenzyl esterase
MKNLLLAMLINISAFAQLPKEITVTGGKISGAVPADIATFKGIPFAAPPVGSLRWKNPQPVIPWQGVKQCTAFGPSPMQGEPAPFSMWTEEFLIPKQPISEDCLYLNVWTGAKKSTEKRPVLVWIYGGGFMSGGSAVPLYDGEALAKKGIVVVSINYRVGIFGFLAHPELSAESGHNVSGNYGLMDQIAALQWVKQNITAFGGDPDNVTIMGQSAGSMSVSCLVASPLAKGLFNKAIAQSGAAIYRDNNLLDRAEKDGQYAQVSLGKLNLEQLRNATAAELMMERSQYGPTVDGYVLAKPVKEIFENGEQNDVLLLTGWNQDEGIIFNPVEDAAAYKRNILQQFGEYASQIIKYYPGGNDTEAKQSELYLSRDMVFGLGNYTWANLQSLQGKKVYVYRFARKVPAYGDYVKYGAFHSGELAYVFNNLKFANRPWLDADRKLAETMSDYWVNFIEAGNPNGRSLPRWPEYDANSKKIMEFNLKATPTTLPDADALDALKEVLRKLP